jgi:hypothetical protein
MAPVMSDLSGWLVIPKITVLTMVIIVTMSMIVFWVVTPCGLSVVTGVLEESTASFFRVKSHIVTKLAVVRKVTPITRLAQTPHPVMEFIRTRLAVL